MAIISKMLKGIFGDKSSKDRKLIWPIVEQINEFQNTIIDKSDDDILYREAYKNHPSTIWVR